MPVDADSYGWYTIPVLWTIPDPAPQEDIIALLITKVNALRDAEVISKSGAVPLLQALEAALRFRGDGKKKQACEALDRFITHVRQLVKEPAVADELISLAQQAILQMGGTPKDNNTVKG
jgi:hypothetical protein